jgi:S1-C subfamily serine protease
MRMGKYFFHHKGLLALAGVVLFISSPSAKADFMSEEQQTINTTQKLLSATVKIEPESLSHGTGFYIARDTILTNEHVIHNVSNNTLRIKRHDGISCNARIGYREEGTDLALLHVDCLSDIVLHVAEGYKIGQSIIVAGNPGSYDFTVSKGIVSATRADRVQFDARVDFGSSGGVVADLSGNVVGVEVEMAAHDNYVAFAIPANRVNQFLDRAGVEL